MIQEQYISFETAKLLKQKEFNGTCEHTYDLTSRCISNVPFPCKNTAFIAAPTQAMAMAWLRDKHCVIAPMPNSFCADGSVSGWTCCIWVDDNLEIDGEPYNPNAYKKYEEAVESAIRYCLENLIK